MPPLHELLPKPPYRGLGQTCPVWIYNLPVHVFLLMALSLSRAYFARFQPSRSVSWNPWCFLCQPCGILCGSPWEVARWKELHVETSWKLAPSFKDHIETKTSLEILGFSMAFILRFLRFWNSKHFFVFFRGSVFVGMSQNDGSTMIHQNFA